jgi:hypothetical protein
MKEMADVKKAVAQLDTAVAQLDTLVAEVEAEAVKAAGEPAFTAVGQLLTASRKLLDWIDDNVKQEEWIKRWGPYPGDAWHVRDVLAGDLQKAVNKVFSAGSSLDDVVERAGQALLDWIPMRVADFWAKYAELKPYHRVNEHYYVALGHYLKAQAAGWRHDMKPLAMTGDSVLPGEEQEMRASAAHEQKIADANPGARVYRYPDGGFGVFGRTKTEVWTRNEAAGITLFDTEFAAYSPEDEVARRAELLAPAARDTWLHTHPDPFNKPARDKSKWTLANAQPGDRWLYNHSERWLDHNGDVLSAGGRISDLAWYRSNFLSCRNVSLLRLAEEAEAVAVPVKTTREQKLKERVADLLRARDALRSKCTEAQQDAIRVEAKLLVARNEVAALEQKLLRLQQTPRLTTEIITTAKQAAEDCARYSGRDSPMALNARDLLQLIEAEERRAANVKEKSGT